MARSGASDPFDRYRWTVSIDGFTKLGFASCSTPEYSISVRKYAEGGAHLTPRKIIDTVDYRPVILSRGVTNDTSFNRWATGAFDLLQTKVPTADIFGSGEAFLGAVQDNFANSVPAYGNEPDKYPFKYRRDVKIEHIDRSGNVQVIYYLYNAFPSEYKPASDFDAKADGEVSIETLTLEYEGFEVKYTGLAGAGASAVSSLF